MAALFEMNIVGEHMFIANMWEDGADFFFGEFNIPWTNFGLVMVGLGHL